MLVLVSAAVCVPFEKQCELAHAPPQLVFKACSVALLSRVRPSSTKNEAHICGSESKAAAAAAHITIRMHLMIFTSGVCKCFF